MRDDPNALMLFAAGFGTRMAPLTDHLPKPLIEVAGKPLLDHALAVVRAAGVRQVVANTHYLPDRMRAALDDRGIATLHEPVILETGGGLRNALPLLGPGPVMTLNTDSVWTGPNPIGTLRRAWAPDQMDALLLVVPRDRAVGYRGAGDFRVDPEGRLVRGPGVVYSGLQILKTDSLAGIDEDVFSLNRVWDRMLDAGRLFGVVHPGGWCDVGRPDSIPLAEALLRGEDV
jgi:MurNAc alpha-1-phosphate uridylyltransferase